jgi:putative oxidoreductase
MADNLGKLLLRLMIGGMLLLHGIYKLQHGIGHIQEMLTIHHIPTLLSYGVYLGECMAPLMLILGIYSRIWAGVILINMSMALWLTNFKGIATFGAYGAWGAQSIMFFLLGALTIILVGSGKYAIRKD